jgi:hypothetical protein
VPRPGKRRLEQACIAQAVLASVFTYLIGLSRLNDGPSQPERFVHSPLSG